VGGGSAGRQGALTNAAPSGGGLTVLRCIGEARATKRFAWNNTLREYNKISYSAGARFHPTEHRVTDLAELAALLDQLRRDPRVFVVRGALTGAAAEALAADPQHLIRRRKLLRENVTPTLAEVPRRWLMLDFDNWPLRPSDDLAADPESAIEAMIAELLPEAFQDAECWWQLSSSAGFAPGFLKVHLFFWLAEPATNEHIKAVLRQHAPGVRDLSPFSAAQPHFVADPIVEGGPDPIPRRTGWRKGLDAAVQLPALRPVERLARPVGGASTGGGGISGAIARLGDGPGLDGFHAPLLGATMVYARRAARDGIRDDAAVIRQLLAAIEAAPRAASRAGVAAYDVVYLQRIIDGAFSVVAGEPDAAPMQPHHAGTVHTLEEARAALAQHVNEFFSRALDWHAMPEEQREPPEHAGLAVGVGTGKSTTARAALPGFIAAAKAAGLPHRVLWLVPTLKLADECLAEMRRLGINAAVMRGRDAVVPGSETPDSDAKPQTMCMDLDAVEDALSVHVAIEQYVCGSPKGEMGRCAWRVGPDQCAFQRQKTQVAEADVIVAAHQTMFFKLARQAGDGLAAVVIDESWWQAGLNPNRTVHLDGFAQEPTVYPVLDRQYTTPGSTKSWINVRNVFATEELHAISAKAEALFNDTPPGELAGTNQEAFWYR
jgi:hypothetical protein